MNCRSCGASLQVGATHCYWCYEPVTPAPPQPTSLKQFASPFISPQATLPQYTPPLPIAQTRQHVPSTIPIHSQDGGSPGKRKRAAPLLILSLLFLLSIAAVLIGGYYIHKQMNALHSTARIFARQLDNPTGQSISPRAASILSHPQVASAIDNALTPTHLTNTFTTGQHVYLTFSIDSKGLDGTIQARWYADGQQVSRSLFHHAHENTTGLVSYVYTVPARVGVVALFWCRQQDCSDAQLALVMRFTVLVGNNPVVSIQQMGGATSASNSTPRQMEMLSPQLTLQSDVSYD